MATVEEARTELFSRRWAKIALLFLVISSIAGVVLRYYNFSPNFGLNYRNIVHTHSHLALLGWLHLGFTTLIIKEFVPNAIKEFKKIQLVTLIAVLGMMVSFPFEGYGPVSISFSTLFIFATYWFTFCLLRRQQSAGQLSMAEQWVRWSLIFLVVSSLGPWTLGPIMVWGEGMGVVYNLAVYFYLHFAYNGFFVLALFGLIQRRLEIVNIKINKSNARKFYYFTVGSVIPAYALSGLWANPPTWIHLVGAVSGLMQLIGLLYGWEMLKKMLAYFSNRWQRILFLLVIITFILKLIFQFLSAIPVIEDFVYESRTFVVIGYLHMVMLGLLSLFVIAYAANIKLYTINKLAGTGVLLFLSGLFFSELVLFTNGLMISTLGEFVPGYSSLMLYTSMLMPTGIVLFWYVQVNRVKTS